MEYKPEITSQWNDNRSMYEILHNPYFLHTSISLKHSNFLLNSHEGFEDFGSTTPGLYLDSHHKAIEYGAGV